MRNIAALLFILFSAKSVFAQYADVTGDSYNRLSQKVGKPVQAYYVGQLGTHGFCLQNSASLYAWYGDIDKECKGLINIYWDDISEDRALEYIKLGRFTSGGHLPSLIHFFGTLDRKKAANGNWQYFLRNADFSEVSLR